MNGFVSRLERFAEVDSTQRVVAEWLARGVPEVCVATSDAQSAGRGRKGRTWTAPPGAALLLTAGFRPRALPLERSWRVAAAVSLAMVDAAEEVAGLREGTIGLKWPNDLVADGPDGELRKLAGVLGETSAGETSAGETGAGERGEGEASAGERGRDADGPDALAVAVGIGVNVDWAPGDFPAALRGSMTSLRELSGRPVDRDALLDAWLDRLEPRYESLRMGRFDAATWSLRQRTTGRRVEVDRGDRVVAGLATGVDPERGSLLVIPDGSRDELAVAGGEVVRCRIARPAPG